MRFFRLTVFMLGLYRFLIDRVDDSIYTLLCMRTQLARKTQKHKKVIDCPDREHRIVHRLIKKNTLAPDVVQDIWLRIFQESKHQQQQQQQRLKFVDIAARSSAINSTWFHHHDNEF